jgi:hypothetical protein
MWNFDGSNFVWWEDEKENLKKLRFENIDTIPDIESHFVDDEEGDEDY